MKPQTAKTRGMVALQMGKKRLSGGKTGKQGKTGRGKARFTSPMIETGQAKQDGKGFGASFAINGLPL